MSSLSTESNSQVPGNLSLKSTSPCTELADITSDPNGTRAVLEKEQSQNAALSTSNQSLTATNQLLASENGSLKAANASLKTSIANLNIQIEKLNSSTPAPIAATPAPTQKTYIPPAPLPAQPNWVWNATNGRVYKNVIVTKAEADCVTILDDEGGALVPLAGLPPDLQKLFNYDPSLAEAAALERNKSDAQSSAMVESEKKLKSAALAAEVTSENQQSSKYTKSEIQADVDQIQAKITAINYDRELSRAEEGPAITQQRVEWNTQLLNLKYAMSADKAALAALPK